MHYAIRNSNNTISTFTYPSIDILKSIIYTTIFVPFFIIIIFLLNLFIYTFFLRKIKDDITC